jgi:uncharacterized protein (DUF849 family)
LTSLNGERNMAYELKGTSELPLGKKLIINVALTGNLHSKEDNGNVPITPDEIASDAKKCFEAGATVFHLHAREDDGSPSHRKELFEEIISKVRKACPEALLCVSTSGRSFKTFEERSESLDVAGELKPDFASLMPGSANFPNTVSSNPPELIKKLIAAMDDKGIRPEVEVLDTGMANYTAYLLRKGFLKRPLYLNLILGSLGTMPGRMVDLCHLAHSLPEGSVWGAGGAGRFQLSVNTASLLMGGHVRTGLEDNLYYDYDKSRPATNEELVKRIVRIANEIGRPVATPADARELLGL